MTVTFFDRFQNTGTMSQAESDLLELGNGAVPILESLFNGEARNEYGVPYRQLGLPLSCAIETASRLGPLAKPLEPHLRVELERGDSAAARALRSLGELDEESIVALAASLTGAIELSLESATTLVHCGAASHASVEASLSGSREATFAISWATSRYQRLLSNPNA